MGCSSPAPHHRNCCTVSTGTPNGESKVWICSDARPECPLGATRSRQWYSAESFQWFPSPCCAGWSGWWLPRISTTLHAWWRVGLLTQSQNSHETSRGSPRACWSRTWSSWGSWCRTSNRAACGQAYIKDEDRLFMVGVVDGVVDAGSREEATALGFGSLPC